MNKIIREHYPVSSLPEDLRAGLDPRGDVRVVIEEQLPASDHARTLRALLDKARKATPVSDDPVSTVRQLRDEWDR
jgi:hypothetical protein